MPGQSSFRRILLSRLLLLSVPVLLAGVYVTYRKARSTLLETARQNLTESAVKKGENIQQSIDALKANLVTASETVVLQSQSKNAYAGFISQLAQEFPTQVQCVQLSQPETRAVVASTCGNQLIAPQQATLWLQQKSQSRLNRSEVYVTTLLPQQSPNAVTANANESSSTRQLNLVLSAPVYNSDGQLQYVLSFQSALLKQGRTKPKSLFGYPVVINQKGIILAHIDPKRVGRNIDQERDSGALQEIVVTKALSGGPGRQGSQHLFAFEKKGIELVAGYTSIPSPLTDERNQRWTILAITPSDNALHGLKDIQQVLFLLTCCLIAASFLATLYVARDLARPLEKLRDYALNQSELHRTARIPHNFKIREFNQLSEALDGMIERLRDWAEELEAAWKEAQTANQLKNEFLANTSHELRTPLNGIIGCLRLVRDGFCDDREEELDFLQRADDAAIHLLGIINDVLDIAKIEAGKLSVEIEPTDLRKLLNEVINLQAVPIQHKGIEFHTADLHDVIAVNADPAKLKQVLLNVVSNAVKFTDSGSITIQTQINPVPETQPSTDDGSKVTDSVSSSSFVVVTVKDTGIGIDPDQQHKLFRPFVMVDGSTTRKCGGTGLGLAISRNLIELMGGTITLFSEGNGKGTTVEITLPIIESSLLFSGESPKSSHVTQVPVVNERRDDNNTADWNGSVPHSSKSAAPKGVGDNVF